MRRGSRTRGSIVLPAVLLAAACGEHQDQRSSRMTVDTLAGGVVQVTSSASGIWGAGEGWTLREELRIGSREGGGPDVFGRVAAIEVDGAGRIHVLDGQSREVRVFAPDGAHMSTLGREGEGPGEFLNPVGLSIHPSDGSLWVTDARNARYTVYGQDGSFRSSHPRPFGFMALPWPGGFDGEGRFHDVGSADGLVFVRFDGSLAPADTFRLPQLDGERITVTRSDGMPVMSLTPPFAPRVHWSFDPRGYVWTATSDAYRFTQHTLEGDPVRIVTREHEPVPVTRHEADSVRASIRDIISMNAGPDARVDGELHVADRKPAFRTFLVDRTGRLWVEPHVSPGAPRVLEVFAADGGYLGAVEVDPRLNLLSVLPRFADGHLYAVVTDELDIQYVVRYRIEVGDDG